jgi:hypothetical protein
METMTVRPLLKHIALGITIWAIAVLAGCCWWSLLAVGADQDPTNYAYARSYLQGEASSGAMPQSVADQRLSAVRWRLFHWIVAQVRLAVLLSSLTIPLLVALLSWYPHDRWVAWSLALLCAGVVPFMVFAVAPLLPHLRHSSPAIGQPTPVAAPTAPVFHPPSWAQ